MCLEIDTMSLHITKPLHVLICFYNNINMAAMHTSEFGAALVPRNMGSWWDKSGSKTFLNFCSISKSLDYRFKSC